MSKILEDWIYEELTSEEMEILSEELLAACGLGCGGHNADF